MSEVWIEDARLQVCVVCNYSEVLWKVSHQGWYALRPEEHGSATDDARAAERSRLGTLCRGSKLDAKRNTQLFEAHGPSPRITSEVFERAAEQRKLQPQCRCYTFENQKSKRISKIYEKLSWSQ
jgi:hypothetical protein